MKRINNGHYIAHGIHYMSTFALNKSRKQGNRITDSGIQVARCAAEDNVHIIHVPTEARARYSHVNAYPREWLERMYPARQPKSNTDSINNNDAHHYFENNGK